MADEHCVFPGGDPRAPGRWLDRDAAERLLRKEPLEAADADIRDQADRLAEALDSLGARPAETASAGAELPGEAAALAAFRAARTGREGEEASLAPHSRTRTSAPSRPAQARAAVWDAGLVRIGRSATDRGAPSGWGRPVRYGLAAALAAGMIGGVAMAATAGVLAFGGDEPEPGASTTVAVTPDRPLLTPSPTKSRRADDEPRPEGSAGAPAGGNSAPRDEAQGNTGTGTGAQPDAKGTGRENRSGQRWAKLASACRDYRDGKHLDAGNRRTLESAARGAEQVQKYCKGILKTWESRDDRDPHDPHDPRGSDDGGGGDPRSGPGDAGGGEGGGSDDDTGGGGDDGDGGGHGGDDGSHIETGTFRGDEETLTPDPRVSALQEPLTAATSRTASPEGSSTVSPATSPAVSSVASPAAFPPRARL
ncbi:hypothetical protein [Streptomyces aurantiacus]|uniref:hypothetical protein n=1 Tax=Streptomyces aurantiacus TaxID=47760 RepID=UPI0006E3E73B|nr:hypothetical protein [Streptomyces aurantiacus]